MKYCRFQGLQGMDGPQFAAVEERDGTLWATRLIASPWNWAPGNDAVAARFTAMPLSELALLPPVAPSKIICVGRNYRDHAKELGNEVPAEPLLFFKPPSSLLAPGGMILMPGVSERVDFEGELAVVIGRRARRVKASEDISAYIHGFTVANDVTARDLQKKDGQWTRAKGFDTFCPVGPVVETEFNISGGVTVETRVNGELRQSGSTADLIFTLPVLLEYITAAMTLEPGDLLLTGTPAGVGPLKAGDLVEVSVPGLGRLSNPVAGDQA
jgi:2-keto-4-pentenoate hydratase/2-oxohepta-3-ene-1,7-dioic acid hydratase in catechol pathway